jgi:Spy/CpxP family protein refolding chaperone
MNKKLMSVMVGLALLVTAGLGFAAGPGFGPGPGFQKGQGSYGCPYGYDRLNLAPEQKTKLNELKDKYWKETAPLRNEMHTKRLELQTLWTAPNPDKDKINAKQKELNDLSAKLQTKSTEYRLEARKNLTPEQAAEAGIHGPGMGYGKGGFGRGMMMGGRGMGFGPAGVCR